MLEQAPWSLGYTLGGLACAVVAGGAGLRLHAIKRRLDLNAAAADHEVPVGVMLFFNGSIFLLHAPAALFGFALLLDLMFVQYAPGPGVSAAFGYLGIAGMGLCGLAMVGLGSLDFRLKLFKVWLRVLTLLAGVGGVACAVIGVIMMVRFGAVWPAR